MTFSAWVAGPVAGPPTTRAGNTVPWPPPMPRDHWGRNPTLVPGTRKAPDGRAGPARVRARGGGGGGGARARAGGAWGAGSVLLPALLLPRAIIRWLLSMDQQEGCLTNRAGGGGGGAAVSPTTQTMWLGRGSRRVNDIGGFLVEGWLGVCNQRGPNSNTWTTGGEGQRPCWWCGISHHGMAWKQSPTRAGKQHACSPGVGGLSCADTQVSQRKIDEGPDLV